MTELIAWIDTETTGLDPKNCLLLEVACIITDEDFNQIGKPFEGRIRHNPERFKQAYEDADQVVKDMHQKTGLWDNTGSALGLVDLRLSLHLQDLRGDDLLILGGNSITLDRNFIQTYLPHSFKELHYRSLDMSSVAKFFNIAGNVPWMEKSNDHTALTDIRNSIAEAIHYRNQLTNKLGEHLV